MASEQNIEYEWNGSRKLWHLVGCLAMLVIFFLWKGLNGPILGEQTLLVFVWAEVAICGAVDIMRFYSPKRNDVVKGLPFYGKLMRRIEENHFNAMTYYLLAAAILATCNHLGWCTETTLVFSIAVLGVADPAAAWVRYQFAKHGIGQEKAFGLLTFIVCSYLVMWGISWYRENDISSGCLLCIGLIVALIESYTKYWVTLVRPVTRRVQKLIAHRTTVWLFQFYPDDNLLIPLTVAILAGVLRHAM